MKPTIETLLVRYVEARDIVADLESQRGSMLCEYEADPELTGVVHPCWKTVATQPDEWGSDAEHWGDTRPKGWCATCLARHAIHGRLRLAIRVRTGRHNGMVRAIRARYMPKRVKKEPAPIAVRPFVPTPIDDDDEWGF